MLIYLRLILYFPVSALVTLFANILQNPQDARARSDVKLMNQVVNFLSMLVVTEEQGSVKRMLGVCAEFERIARVVLEKGDKESHSRRKRRSSNINENDLPQNPQQQVSMKRAAPPTPQSNNAATPQNFFTPNFNGDMSNQAFTPNLQGFSPDLSNLNLPMDFSGADFPNMMTPSNGMENFPHGDMNGQQYSNQLVSVGSFQQPFVPQDLWQMPMTLEWDWADMGGANGFPATFDHGQGQDQQQQQNGMNGMNGNGQMSM